MFFSRLMWQSIYFQITVCEVSAFLCQLTVKIHLSQLRKNCVYFVNYLFPKVGDGLCVSGKVEAGMSQNLSKINIDAFLSISVTLIIYFFL